MGTFPPPDPIAVPGPFSLYCLVAEAESHGIVWAPAETVAIKDSAFHVDRTYAVSLGTH